MQTKREIQALLAEAGVRPNKRLGQHFLIDLNLMRLMIESAGIRGNDVVLEVGCGTGSLTAALAEKAGRVVAIEIDARLAEIARRQVGTSEKVDIINTDILSKKSAINSPVADALTVARQQLGGRVLLVANLPYNVASALIVDLVVGPVTVDEMSVTVQEEVAERMTAGAGGGEYGSLSIMLAATGDAEMMRVLKPSVFWPQPEVNSAMVRFVRSAQKAAQIEDIGFLGEVLRLFIGHRRKTMRACTRFASGRLGLIGDWAAVFEACGVDGGKRPEELSPGGYVRLANHCRALVGEL